MAIRTYKILFLTFLVLISIVAPSGLAAPCDDLSLNDFRLGQSLDDIRSRGDFFSSSRILENGQSVVTEDSSAHLIDGRVQLIGGTSLRLGTGVVIAEGQTRKQLLATAQELGWAVVKEWDSSSDVPGYKYSIIKLGVPGDAYLLVSLLKGKGDSKVSEIYLRSSSVKGPYGDE